MMAHRKASGRRYHPLWWLSTILLTLFLAACSPGLSKSSLDEHDRKWTQAGISSYSYDLVRYCFCEGSGETINVNVREGGVVSARYDGEAVRVSPPKGLTIREIYDVLQSAIEDSDVKVTASFSEDGIIPVDVSIKHATAMDADMSITVSNFRIPD